MDDIERRGSRMKSATAIHRIPHGDVSSAARKPDRMEPAIQLFHRIGQLVDDHFAARIGDSELTPRQFTVLDAIGPDGAMNHTTITLKTGIDRSTMSDIVRRLTTKGLLQRSRSRDDARAYVVRLTQRGKAELSHAASIVMSVDEALFASISPDDRRLALEILSRVVDRAGQKSAAPAGAKCASLS